MDGAMKNTYDRVEAGIRFKELRGTLGKTQEEFAELLGLSVNSIKKIEGGENNVSISNLRKLYKLYNVSADYILFGENESADNIWFLIQNSDDKEKFKLFLRLAKYFGNKERNFYIDKLGNEDIFSVIEKILEDNP